jgi:hypothetical protein
MLATLIGIVLAIWLSSIVKNYKSFCSDEVIGDGFCDDRQNIKECEYDGLDCCIRSRELRFCEDCICHLGK